MELPDWFRRVLGLQGSPAPAPSPPQRPPSAYLESRFPAPRTRFREEEQERKAAAERWIAEVREAFDFLRRDFGATVEFGEEGTHPWTRMPTAVFALPTLSVHLASKPVTYSVRVPLANEGGSAEVYEFDLAEIAWHLPRLPSRAGSLPRLHTQKSYEKEPIATVATRLARYCDAELRGDLSAFREIVALRRAGGTPDPRAPRWRGFTTNPDEPLTSDDIHLPSPDGRYVATMHGAGEMGMGGPVRGTLRLSSGREVPSCNPHMVWSADSRHLAVLRIDVVGRRTLLAVVRASDGELREMAPDGLCFPRLASFEDGVVVASGHPPFDVRPLCA